MVCDGAQLWVWKCQNGEHPAAADYLTLATVVIDTHNLGNWKVVVGTKGGQDRKNLFFQSVNLTEPVLAQAECLRLDCTVR